MATTRPADQPGALAILVAAMAATVVLPERIYRRALLQTRGRVTLR